MTRELILVRNISNAEATLGFLFLGDRYLCATLEDQHQAGPKVPGETRIPAGRYKLRLRTWGGFHGRYSQSARIGPMHKGMIELMDVPGFEHILIHCGNTDDDTAGCLLVGQPPAAFGSPQVNDSVDTYTHIYPQLVHALAAGALFITIKDADHDDGSH